MNILEIVPEVRLCTECGLHGHFTIPANNYSLEFCSIDQGLEQIAYEVANNNISAGYDLESLKSKIFNCALPKLHTEVPLKLLWTIKQWNDDHEECRNDGTILQYNAHAFTEHPDIIIQIPKGFRRHLTQRLRAFQAFVPTTA